MKLAVDKAVELCNQLQLPDTYVTPPFAASLIYQRYNLVHTAPVYDLPGLLINDTNNLTTAQTTQESVNPIGNANLGIKIYAGTSWVRLTQYLWQIVASRIELTFNKTTQLCVDTRLCTSSNNTKETVTTNVIHNLYAPSFDIVANRNVGGCGSFAGAKGLGFLPGQC